MPHPSDCDCGRCIVEESLRTFPMRHATCPNKGFCRCPEHAGSRPLVLTVVTMPTGGQVSYERVDCEHSMTCMCGFHVAERAKEATRIRRRDAQQPWIPKPPRSARRGQLAA